MTATKKTKRILSAVFALAIVMCSLLAMGATASAATCSSGRSTRTITVKTKANYLIPGSESITLSQTKGVCTKNVYNIFTGKTKTTTSKQYGRWNIVVKATDGSHTFKKSLTDGSIKLNLKPNKTYTITVSWDTTAATLKEIDKGNYTTYPTWRVKSTWKVSSYY